MRNAIIIVLILGLNLIAFNSRAALNLHQKDTIVPSEHKFVSEEIYIPKTFDPATLVKQFMEHLQEGKHTIGFVHEDDLAMIEEKNLTEKRLFFDSYKVVSIGKRMAMVQVYTVRGTSITCKLLTLRYYQNMNGHFLLVPGKVEKFEKRMGDITIKKVFLNTWTMESRCQ